jgi:hypothetical protein
VFVLNQKVKLILLLKEYVALKEGVSLTLRRFVGLSLVLLAVFHLSNFQLEKLYILTEPVPILN